MRMRCTRRARRGLTALTVAAGLTLAMASCGGGTGADDKPGASAAASADSEPDSRAQEGQDEEPLAELKGPEGLLLQIMSAQRDSGGFVTVNGVLKNDGAKGAVVPAALSGNETEIVRNGRSLGGATLVDSKSKKRYYVLRDTEGRPLTTSGFSTIRAGDSLSVFMQFPAPPAESTDVTFQLPTFPAATISITG